MHAIPLAILHATLPVIPPVTRHAIPPVSAEAHIEQSYF